MATSFGRIEGIPDRSVMHCVGQRSCRGQPGSTRGQIAYKWPMATKFGRKNPWSKCYALLRLKVMQGSLRVNQSSNCLKMPMATKLLQCCMYHYCYCMKLSISSTLDLDSPSVNWMLFFLQRPSPFDSISNLDCDGLHLEILLVE